MEMQSKEGEAVAQMLRYGLQGGVVMVARQVEMSQRRKGGTQRVEWPTVCATRSRRAEEAGGGSDFCR